METHIIVFQTYFAATLEEVTTVVDKYLSKLIENKPDAVLDVSTSKERSKTIWKGKIFESKEWGKPDLDYGYIEIAQVYENTDSLMQVSLYSSHPNYTIYWSGLASTLQRHLPVSDGSPGPTDEPWNLIPDKGHDREILRLWRKGFTANEIGARLDLSARTIYDDLRLMRKENGVILVPYKMKRYKSKENP